MGLHAQVVMPLKTGLSGDVVVNTFAIGGATGADGSTALTAITAAIAHLYNTQATGAARALGAYLGYGVSRATNGATIKLYDIGAHLDGSPHGSPVFTNTFTVPAGYSNDTIPEECAVVATLEAVGRGNQLVETPDGIDPGFAPDRPRERYTGRIYFGPLINGSVAWGYDATTARSFVGSALNTDLRQALKALYDEIQTISSSYFLGVWSRKDQAIRGIGSVSVDDALDTQRRRGPKPTSRSRTTVTSTPHVELAA